MFTMHGVVMVFFFLIPSIPATLGNFLIPIMIGREGSGVSAHQPPELVHLHARRRASRSYAALSGGVDTGWTFYTPYSTAAANSHVMTAALGHLHHRLLVDPDRPQLHRHDPPDARAGPDLVPAAALRVGALRDQPDHDPRHAGDRDHGADGRSRARAAHRASSIRRSAATRSSSSTCSGSTRTRRSTS